jgi:hypothetical protein
MLKQGLKDRCRLYIKPGSNSRDDNGKSERAKKEMQMNLIKVHYMHAFQYHNETPLYN